MTDTNHYIVEVPHQHAPSVWRGSEATIIAAVNATIIQRRQDYELVDTLAQAIEYIGHDAHGIAVYDSVDEVLDDLIPRRKLPGHQCGKSLDALVRALQRDGVLDSDRLTESARALALAIWREQLAGGSGDPSEEALLLDGDLTDWLGNRTYPDKSLMLIAAVRGDVTALAEVRTEAGLPLLA